MEVTGQITNDLRLKYIKQLQKQSKRTIINVREAMPHDDLFFSLIYHKTYSKLVSCYCRFKDKGDEEEEEGAWN